MTPIAVIGCGKIGETIADLLLQATTFDLRLVDASADALARIPANPRLRKICLDITDETALTTAIGECFAVISAVSYRHTLHVARAAQYAGVHYLDLTEDVANTRNVQAMAASARSTFIPQCGLAPGFVSIIAHELARHFDSIDTLRLRVGALPRYPSNSLNYNLTWSTEGVINEYCEPCVALVDGHLCEVPALEHLEHFSLDGVLYESFNTSGGLGSLADTYAGRARHVNYQTIRYPGHRDIMKTLLHDLRLRDRRDLLKDVLEQAVPTTLQDVVLIFVSVSGIKNNQFVQESYANRIHGVSDHTGARSAIQLTTAGSACAVLELLCRGKLPPTGFVRQEDISLRDFIGTRFGRLYANENAMYSSAS